MTCDRLDDVGAELALGVLPGDQRSAALTHLSGCVDCQRRLRELTSVSDGLLGLLPEVEPPAGFADRVLGELPAAARTRQSSWQSIAVAVAITAVVFGAGGWALGTALRPTPTATVGGSASTSLREAALMTADRREVGYVFDYTGTPSWLYMVVDTKLISGMVDCQLQRGDGTVVSLGWFSLVNGYGHWAAPTPGDASTYVGTRLISTDGTVIASGTFGAPRPN